MSFDFKSESKRMSISLRVSNEKKRMRLVTTEKQKQQQQRQYQQQQKYNNSTDFLLFLCKSDQQKTIEALNRV